MKILILILLIFSFFGVITKTYCDNFAKEINLRACVSLKKMNRSPEEKTQETNNGIFRS
jgi:hypothetical protein